MMVTESSNNLTAFQIWKSGPARYEDYDVWLPNVVPRIMEKNSDLLTRIDKASYEILVVVEEMYRLGEYAGNQKMFSEWIGKLNKIAEDMTKGITING